MNDLTGQRYSSGVSVPQDSLSILRSFLAKVDESLAKEAADPPLQQFFVEFPTHPDLLKESLRWFDSLSFPPLLPRLLIECKTMLGEAVDNVRDHAHEHFPPTTTLTIAIHCFPSFLCLQIWDQGQGFDLVGHLRTKEQWPDSGATRGRGLKILEELSDRLGYVPCQPKGNCLILVKRYI
ncbi:MAG: ATP-binding protein [Prochlorotrichaceae cyanobacterium]|jgi:anti-sigma regulatory factor (Ser/Thr protein kinase)